MTANPAEAAAIRTRIGSSSLVLDPYPHLVVDDLIPETLFRDIDANWPTEGWAAEVPGNFVHNIKPPVGAEACPRYWIDWLNEYGKTIIGSCLEVFAPFISEKFEDKPTLYKIYYYTLMEFNSDEFVGHAVHNHHYHDPIWVCTALIYLDENPGWIPGTTMFEVAVPPGRDRLECQAWVAAQAGRWWELPEVGPAKTVAYRRGRMFCFHDCVSAYHGVVHDRGAPTATGPNRPRRIIRMHVGVDRDYIRTRYGVSYRDYLEKLAGRPAHEPNHDPEVIACMERDVRSLESTKDRLRCRLGGASAGPPAPIELVDEPSYLEVLNAPVC